MRCLTILLIPTLMLAAGGAPAAGPETALPTVDEVLARFVDAVGGRDAIVAQEGRHYRGVIVEDLSWKDPRRTETPFVADVDAAGRTRWAESADWSALDGAAAPDRDKILWLLQPQGALRVQEFFPDLSVTGRESLDGRPVLALAPRDLKPAHYTLYFDEESGLLVRIGYYNDLGDWRAVDGVLFPHRWAFSRKGGQTVYVFEEAAGGPAPGRRQPAGE